MRPPTRSRIRPLITNPRGSPGSPRLLRRRGRAVFDDRPSCAPRLRRRVGRQPRKDQDRGDRDQRHDEEPGLNSRGDKRRVAKRELNRSHRRGPDGDAAACDICCETLEKLVARLIAAGRCRRSRSR